MAVAAQQLRQRLSWEEVCDDFAQVAALEFARKCCQFAADNMIQDVSSFFAKASKRFVEKFRVEYESELKRLMHNSEAEESPNPNLRKAEQDISCRDKSQTDQSESKSPKQSRISRKLSLRLKSIFKKQENKENVEPVSENNGHLEHPDVGLLVDISPEKESTTSTGNEKTGTGHDIIKEGLVHELINIERNGDVELTWQKCKLVLARAPGGYMLEFYIPPKV